MNILERSLILRMEQARDFELAIRAAYLDLAAHADACAAFHLHLVCHGERSAVQAARIERALSLTLAEDAAPAEARPENDVQLPAACLPRHALDLADREIAMYRECLGLARETGAEDLARLCKALLEEEICFRATVSDILQREGAMPTETDPILRLVSTVPAAFAPVNDEARLCMGAA